MSDLISDSGRSRAPSISVVVPALNEQDTVQRVVEWTLSVLAEMTDDYEVIIVDDGSTDETGCIADALAAQSVHVRVVHNAEPSGYGGALASGFIVARNELIGLITADCEFHPTDLPQFVDAIHEADIVTSIVPHRPLPFYRKVLSWGWRTCMRTLLGERPILEGTFMIRNQFFRLLDLESRSGMYVMEMLIKARRLGARMKVIAIDVHPRQDMSKSKVANVRTVATTFKEILALRRRLASFKPAITHRSTAP
jgi:glycosyltransferase involved in cell wall biosynthesis